MKHINTLHLTNFQQWKTGKIKFLPGLNILVGNTESGKSTLFRAINSILTGKMPEDYIRKGTKGCEVKIDFSDGTSFRRARNKKDNIADANGEIFERVGKEIPAQYFKKLGPTSIVFGSKELSLCSYNQFEPHFFITLSGYDKSKLIGTICGIDIVDKLMDIINKDIRKTGTNLKFLEDQITKKQADREIKGKSLETLQNKVKTIEPTIVATETAFKTLENLSKSRYKLRLLNGDISTSETQLNGLKRKIRDFNPDKAKSLQKLLDFYTNLSSVNAELQNQQNLRDNLILTGQIDKDKVNLLDDLYFLKTKLAGYLQEVEKLQVLKQGYDSKVETLELEKRDLLKDYDKCPLCGGIL